MNTPIVSFIIPVYNVKDYLAGCIDSILCQTIDNIEIIVVDDGSTDGSSDIADSIASTDRRVTVIHKKNEGVSTARNTGIDASRGEYLVFVDADDYLSKDYTEYMLNLVEPTGAEFGLSLNCFTRKNEENVSHDEVSIIDSTTAKALLLSPRIIVGCWNKIFRSSVIKEKQAKFATELFYGEGLHFITRFADVSTRIAVGNRKVYFYRRNNYSSATSSFNIDKYINGAKAIDLIEDNVDCSVQPTFDMLNWHRCQFYMGAVVRIKTANRENEYSTLYKKWLSYVRKNTLKVIFSSNLPLYNRGLLVGCCISPSLMAFLDKKRRKYIANNSVEKY